MNTGMLLSLLSFLAGGLALLLARETRLRRALQALCSRLLARLAEKTTGTRTRPIYQPKTPNIRR